MKVIFLDFDGVLINRASYRLPGSSGSASHTIAHPDCVAALNYIGEQTGAHVVVSSTWRKGARLGALKDRLLEWGVRCKAIDVTPDLWKEMSERGMKPGSVHVNRGDEIQRWLDTYNRHHVESFVILDDDSDMVHLSHRLVKCEYEFGLTMEHAERAIRMLMEG